MKKYLFIILSLSVLLFASCSESVSETVTYQINEPVFMPAETFRSSVKVTSNSVGITNYGKIAYYDGYLYISESEKGIHIIDNRNPAKPMNVGFIELLGNADLSIRNNVLYADSYVDLVWFDVSVPAVPVYKGRIENIFPTALPVIDNFYSFDYEMCFGDEALQKGVVIGWDLKERTDPIENYTGGWYWRWGAETDMLYGSNSGGSSNSINGSMSRFTLYDHKLYTVINNEMSIFDLSGQQPVKAAENIYIGGNVETLFSYKDNMFMGTPTGLMIYSVADPLKPVWQSSITHAFGCDPVVVDNDLAYVTIHSGNNCGQSDNELFIVDVADVKNPKQLESFKMINPKGLGIDAGRLFLCDDGLKVFSIESPANKYLKQITHYTGMSGFDLIAYNNILMMIAEDGLYQYDYSNVNDIKLLSKLAFNNQSVK